MIWADRHDLQLEIVLSEGQAIQIVLTAKRAVLQPAESRRLAAALLNAADQLDEIGSIS